MIFALKTERFGFRQTKGLGFDFRTFCRKAMEFQAEQKRKRRKTIVACDHFLFYLLNTIGIVTMIYPFIYHFNFLCAHREGHSGHLNVFRWSWLE